MHAIHLIKTLAVTALCAMAFNAVAETQVWRLTGIIDEHTINDEAFSMPEWLGLNQAVVIDYVIDVDTPLDDVFYNGAVASISFNGQSFQEEGSYGLVAAQSLFALNTVIPPGQSQGVDFVSFLVFNESVAADGLSLAQRLVRLSDISFGENDAIRLDFGNVAGVSMRPKSFTAQAVPEPRTLSMGLIGALALGVLVTWRKRNQSQ